MGFFHFGDKQVQTTVSGLSLDFLHKGGCKVCPLSRIKDNRHPQMEPTGVDAPLIYMLGGAPDYVADRKGRPFAGQIEKFVRLRLPEDIDAVVRWNNVVRTAPPETKDGEQREASSVEVECCRPSIVRDIEVSAPVAIFGFGNAPLHWLIGFNGITKWQGRRVPVKVGKHTCWYFPLANPQTVIDNRRFTPRDDGYGSEQEFAFALELRRALDYASQDNHPYDPYVHTLDDVNEDTNWVTGEGSDDVDVVLQFIDSCYGRPVGLDYETNALRPYKEGAKILTVALSHGGGTMAFPLDHSQSKWSRKDRQEVWKAFEHYLYHSTGRKLVHQLAFEMEWSAFFFGRDVLRAQRWGDSVSQAWVLDERVGMHSLEMLCLQYFGFNLKAISNLDRKNLDGAPLPQVLKYNAIDAKYHRLLYNEQTKRLKEEGLQDVYLSHLERVATCVLTQMKGVPVHQGVVDGFYDQYNKVLVEVEDKMDALPEVRKFKKLKGFDYRPSADRDVKYMMNDVLDHKIENTDKVALLKIKHPIARLTLDWREPAKLLSTYIEPVRVKSDSPHIYSDGLMHPVISTNRTDTGRTSSEDPNAQNWPKRNNKHIRKQITVKPNEKIVSFDYGSIQARNIAMESKDKALIQAFWDRYDIHADWTKRIQKRVPKWIKEGGKVLANDPKLFKWYRNRAKNEFVFPSFFGAKPKSVARYLSLDEKDCVVLQEELWEMFPSVKGWQDRIIDLYHTNGYVTGLSGYRRRAPISPNQLINAPIQADEACMVLDAMTRLSKIDYDRFQANMEIHDDLTFVWPKKDVEANAEVVIREMLTTPFKWAHCVPIVVEMSIGDNWAEQEDVGEFSSDNWSGMDPNTGTWADGTGWANHKGMEKAMTK